MKIIALAGLILAASSGIGLAQDVGKKLVDVMMQKVPGNKFELLGTSKVGTAMRVYYRFENANTQHVATCYPLDQGGWFCEDGATLGRLSGIIK